VPPPVGPLPGPSLMNVTGLQLLFFCSWEDWYWPVCIALMFEVDGCVVIVICELRLLRVWWWCEYLNWCPIMAVFFSWRDILLVPR